MPGAGRETAAGRRAAAGRVRPGGPAAADAAAGPTRKTGRRQAGRPVVGGGATPAAPGQGREVAGPLHLPAGRLAVRGRPDPGRAVGRGGGRLRVDAAEGAGAESTLGRLLLQRRVRVSAVGPGTWRGRVRDARSVLRSARLLRSEGRGGRGPGSA